MNATNNGPVMDEAAQNCAVEVRETARGYVVSKGAATRKRAAMGELAAISACLMFGTLAYAPWVMPAAIYDNATMSMKISGTIMLFVFAALMYLMSRRGLMYEVQIDRQRRTVRCARRNREGAVTIINKFGFSDIGSVHMKRSKTPTALSQIILQPTGRAGAIVVASGPAHELEPILQRMIADMGGATRRPRAASGVRIIEQPAKPIPSAFGAKI